MNTRQRAQQITVASGKLARRSFALAVLCFVLGLPCGESSLAWAEAPAASFVVIVNARNPAASTEQQFLADAMLKKASRWADGEAVRPADLRPDSAVRRAFSLSVIKRPVAAVRSYWQQCIFSGRDVPPPELDSDAAMVRYVAKQRGALGYVSATAPLADGVKVISVR